MATPGRQNPVKAKPLSEKARRLLAAHDHEVARARAA